MSGQMASQPAAQTGTKRSPVSSWLAVALVCVSLVAALGVCVERRLHEEIGTETWGRALFAIGAAITQLKHSGYGYTLSTVIETILTYGGLTNDATILASLGAKFPENLRDPALINAAIDKAVQFKWPFNPNEAVRGSGGDDLGLVDYARLSFLLFGYRVQSLFLTYFLILGASAATFLYAFRFQPALLMLLVVTCVAQIPMFSSILFDRGIVGSVVDPRLLSVLAIIPGLHLSCLMLKRSRPSPCNIVLAAIQSLVLVFAIWIRSSAVWVAVGVALLAALVSIHALFNRRFNPVQVWSLGVLLGVLVLHAVWVSAALHPIYKDKGEISHHVFWHAVFHQLQIHPHWEEKYGSCYDHATGDALPHVAAKKYLSKHPSHDPDIYLTEDRSYLTVAALETYTRKAFVEFLANDPKFVFETVFLHKPKIIAVYLAQYVNSSAHVSAVGYITLVFVFLVVTGYLATENVELRRFAGGVLLLTGAFFISLVPILLTVPAMMVEQYYVLLIALGSWAVLISGAALGLCMRMAVFP
jgi:hypothetical protein